MDNTRKLIEQIAKRHFGVATIETRNSDSKDFYDVSIGAIEEALQAAYEAGKAAAAVKPRNQVRSTGEWYCAYHDRHADGGHEFTRYYPREMKVLVEGRAKDDGQRFMSAADVARVIHTLGLPIDQLDASALR